MMKMMVTIIFESHGTTIDNEADLSSGVYDVELSELGKRQSKELGERYQNDHSIVTIFCSDLRRSWECGKIAFAGRKIPILKDVRLRECDYGEYTRKPDSIVKKLRAKYISEPFPRGESYEQCAARMKDFLQDLLKDYDGKKVLVVGHRATQYGLEHWIKGVPLEDAVTAPWQWQPGWVYELESGKGFVRADRNMKE